MKFITTKEHPVFKEGIKFEIKIESSYDLAAFKMPGISETFYEAVVQCDMELWLKKGYIKEVEEAEFTESDMRARCIEFAYFSFNTGRTSVSESYNDWIKSKEK